MTGARSEIVTFTYNDKGDLIEEVWDTDADGTTDYRVTYTRGDEGQPIERTRDEGTPDTTYQRTRFTYDDLGRPIEQITTFADGAQVRTSTRYDDLGRPTLTQTHALPSNKLLSRTTLQHQPALITRFQDVDGDGQDDERATIELNEEGLPLRRLDGGTTGEPEVETLSTYNDLGLLIRLEVKGLERQPTRTEFFVYDSDGNLTDHAIDADFDLIPETRYAFDYGCWR